MTKFRSDFNEVFRNTEKNFLIKLAKKLSQYDSVDLLTSLAALQLMPENAERTFRFETLTHVVASIKNKGFVSKPKANLKILEKLCRCDAEGLEILVLMEDPFENPFTEAFGFHGGSYTVFPGIAEEATFILRYLSRIISLDTESFSFPYLIYLCLNGRLKAKSSQMKDVMSKVRNLQGTEFNNRVADLLEKNTNLIVKRQVKKVGKTKIQVGDIDVLAVDIQNSCLKLIECKNFAISRAPHEMKNEIDQIFLGRKKNKGKERHKSSVQHHQERLEWVLNHLPEILTWLKLDTSIKWKVEALIVTDIELPTPHLLSSPIPILSFSELAQLYSIE